MSDATLPPPTSEALSHRNELQALEDLVVDNRDLERLEELLGRFNLFEAIGVVRQELRHSDFLAFLLNPQQPHGLGDLFLKRLLQRTLVTFRETVLPISLIDLDVWSLDDTLVLREWNNIDLLLVNNTHRLAIIIENNVDSAEHSAQLGKYYRTIEVNYPGFRLLPLFLTIEGDLPSDDRYLPVSYRQIVEQVEQLLEFRSAMLGGDLQVLLRHYADLMRTHIVSSSEIDDLCQRIYQKHQRALDLIFERRPDRQGEVWKILETLLAETPGLLCDSSSKGAVRFLPQEWDIALLKAGSGWTQSGRILLFEFGNRTDRLVLRLYIGPGPLETRERLFTMGSSHPALFKPTSRSLGQKWNCIYTRQVVAGSALTELPLGDIDAEIRKFWYHFTQRDLPAIREVVENQEWLGTETTIGAG